MSSKTFSPQEVADLSGLKVATILQWIRKKKLKAKRVRGYAVEASAVREFLAQIDGNPKAHSLKNVVG